VGDSTKPLDPTLAVAEIDVRQSRATVTALSFESVTVAYSDHPTYGTIEFEFAGLEVHQLVPFCEAHLRTLGAPVPTVECPGCAGRNVRNCPTCNGLGKALPSQISSQQAAASPTMDKYRS